MSRANLVLLGGLALTLLLSFLAEGGQRDGILAVGLAALAFLFLFVKVRPVPRSSVRTSDEIEQERELIASFDKSHESSDSAL